MKKFAWFVIRCSTVILAVIGAITIIHMSWPQRPMPRPDSVAYRLAPNQKFKAVLADYFGGGGLSPYCFGYVTVVPASASDAVAISRDNLVFSYDTCDSFLPRNGQMEGSPLVEWLADDQLKITFAVNKSRLFPQKFQMRSSDLSGQVKVIFEGRQ